MAVDLTSPSIGMSRETGRVLTGWDHVLQSIQDIITTRFGERAMREWYGSTVPLILGRNITAATITTFMAAFAASVEQFEPRVKVVRFSTVDLGRDGRVRMQMEVNYRPRATLGDFTVEGARKVTIAAAEDGRTKVESIA